MQIQTLDAALNISAAGIIVSNAHAEGATVAKVATGHYQISGTNGLNPNRSKAMQVRASLPCESSFDDDINILTLKFKNDQGKLADPDDNAGIAMLVRVQVERVLSEPDAQAIVDEQQVPVTPQTLTLEQYQAAELAKVNAKFERDMAALVIGYPEREQQTWIVQCEEATALKADPNSEAPLLRALAANRGVDLQALADKVLAKSLAFRQASGALVGQRQAAEDALNALTEVPEFEQTNAAN